ncbi:MAG: cation-translocating P-type ATPase, partial [Flavobacteriales bacterium]|nr:cation-translocating P-type ATPase [Flavobacteriales bacterium]
MLTNIPSQLKGLTEEALKLSREKYGYNVITEADKGRWIDILLDVVKEPMMLLLMAVTVIYTIVGDYNEALFMFVSLLAISAISFYQDNRSKKALKALEKLNEPLSKVIRNAEILEVPTHELAVGDLCVVEEGRLINADGSIVHSNDFSVNESSLTGESFSVFKSSESADNAVYSGTIVLSGLAIFEVKKIGKESRIGKIGLSIKDIEEEKSPLHIQITKFIRSMAIIGIVIFLMVCIVNYYHTHDIIHSLLNGLTLAMSILPEEIPVAFTTFMALGAWKLMREGVIIKRSSIVETLGSTTVICSDKTGTITQNTMQLKMIWSYPSCRTYEKEEYRNPDVSDIIMHAMWSSEPVPFDPMEKSLHQVYEQSQTIDQREMFQMIHEYPLGGNPPMMTHIYEDKNGQRIISAKGAPEAILAVSNLTENEKGEIKKQVNTLAAQGYRILAVGKSKWEGSNFPEAQQDFVFLFLGLLAFEDLPKEDIQQVFSQIHDAGIQLKVITGDYTDTTRAIAKQAGIINYTSAISGEELMQQSEEDLMQTVEERTLFTRMFPDAKLAVVKALKKKGEIVTMLGDGVNDSPALKAAHIGVAMGNKGTEIAKAAADLVITNDYLGKLIIGIAAGRRIYANIKKAIQYIISIHIPIILIVALPLFFGWVYPEIFTPLHVIFLELVMGPTCSIVYENEPMDKNTMYQPPRPMTDTFFKWTELTLSILQGLIITLGMLFIYQYSVNHGGSEAHTRTMVFITLIFSNIFLSFANRSFYYSIIESFKKYNPLLIGINVLVLGSLFVFLYFPPATSFFMLTSLGLSDIGITFGVAAVSVLWFELYKWIKRLTEKRGHINT